MLPWKMVGICPVLEVMRGIGLRLGSPKMAKAPGDGKDSIKSLRRPVLPHLDVSLACREGDSFSDYLRNRLAHYKAEWLDVGTDDLV